MNRRFPRPPLPPPTRVFLLAMAALVAIPGCQSGNGGRSQVGGAGASDFRGQIELEGLWATSESNNSGAAPDYRTREFLTRETAQVGGNGYIYHPNLLGLSADVTLGLVQHRFDSNYPESVRQSGRESGTVTGYDLRADVLRAKSYPGVLYARRYEALEPRPFTFTARRITESYGAEWRYVDETIPTHVLIDRREMDYDELGSNALDYVSEDFVGRFETEYRFSTDNFFTFRYDHRTSDQKPKGSTLAINYDVDEARLGHTLRFGEKDNLDSNLTYYHQTGSADVDRTEWNESLRLGLLESLDGWARTEVSRRDEGNFAGTADLREDRYQVSGGLEHRLYESLFTSINGFVENQDYQEAAEVDRYGIYGSADYRKRNPVGTLDAFFEVSLIHTDNSGSSRVFPVFDEPHTFNDPFPIVLDNFDVIESSIVVTDLTQTIIYQLNVDYTVLTFNRRVEIRRVATGRINNSQTVLVDYDTIPVQPYELESDRYRFRIQQDFDFGLTPYYRYERQNEKVDPSDLPSPVPNDHTRQVVGLRFRTGRFDTSVEYEDYDSNLGPYRRAYADANFFQRVGESGDAQLYATWTRVDYEPPNDRLTRIFILGGRYRHELVTGLRFDALARYRQGKDSTAGDSSGFDGNVALEWNVRKTLVRLEWRLATTETETNDSNWSTVLMQVIREF